MTRPSLLVSDVHLSQDSGQMAARRLVELLGAHPQTEFIFVGDILDLSLLKPGADLGRGAAAALSAHPELLRALQRHVAAGGALTWIPGNHDAGIEKPGTLAALRELLSCPDERQLQVTPWFLRRGQVHIEHGHLYDRDCAPNHPLADFDGYSEGLGTALMRRFVAPNDAQIFAHAHATTPLSGLAAAVSKWRFRAPLVIGSYFRTAISLCAEATTTRGRVLSDRAHGDALLEGHAALVGVSSARLRSLLAEIPDPTHHSLRDTFERLYFDSILAGLSLSAGVSLLGVAGLGLAGAPLTTSGALLSALGASYLARNLLRQAPRYLGPVASLDAAAGLVRKTTQAELVVFGHTHVAVEKPGYVNLGSFGYGRAERPYAVLDGSGILERLVIAP